MVNKLEVSVFVLRLDKTMFMGLSGVITSHLVGADHCCLSLETQKKSSKSFTIFTADMLGPGYRQLM